MRIQSKNEEITRVVERDARLAAAEHAMSAPEPGASGDEMMTQVPVPEECLVITGGTLRGHVAVQGRHRRATGWHYVEHRVVVLSDLEKREVIMASAWAPGAWAGDSTVRVE